MENKCVTKGMPFTIRIGDEKMIFNKKYCMDEFCMSVECDAFYNNRACVLDDMMCRFTAKELYYWLKEKGYEIKTIDKKE